MTTIALEQARQHLETLGLKQAVEALDNTLDAAANKHLTYAEVLAQLLGLEVTARRERYLTTKTRMAHLPFLRTLEQFDFAFQPSRAPEPAPVLYSKRISFQHTFPLPKRGGKEPKVASRANNNTDRKRHSVGKAKEEKLTCEPVQPDRSDRTPGPVQQTGQPLPESSTETFSFTSRQDYERHREQRPERRAIHRRTQQKKRLKTRTL